MEATLCRVTVHFYTVVLREGSQNFCLQAGKNKVEDLNEHVEVCVETPRKGGFSRGCKDVALIMLMKLQHSWKSCLKEISPTVGPFQL